MTYQHNLLTFIGRCEPLHNGHVHTLTYALTISDKVLILLGSSFQASTIKNPWNFDERRDMILSVPELAVAYGQNRLLIEPLSDSPYNDEQWAAEVQRKIALLQMPPAAKIGIIGHKKDESSYYLDMFPQWSLIETEQIEMINATDLRMMYFEGRTLSYLKAVVPPGVLAYLETFKQTKKYAELCLEFKHIQAYKEAWKAAPYAPTFVTTDAVVVQSGHILLVERKHQPGAGLLALPGGFLNQDETLIDGMLRELREETKLKVPAPVLKGSVKWMKAFDKPNRSARGRTITHAYLISLPPGRLPAVKGSDDAATAKWYPLAELKQELMFEDHFHIIQHMTATL